MRQISEKVQEQGIQLHNQGKQLDEQNRRQQDLIKVTQTLTQGKFRYIWYIVLLLPRSKTKSNGSFMTAKHIHVSHPYSFEPYF